MNRTLKIWMLAAILVFCGATMTSCGNKTAKQTENQVQTETPAQPEAKIAEKVVEEPTCFTAIEDYLVNEIGKDYSQGDVCIPYAYVVSTDQSNSDDILVWGDFWVFNYDLVGDTLKTVSGGSHPGLMHVKKTANGFEVTSFDAVADGADNLPTAKKIFGDKFEAFSALNSEQVGREEKRMHITADYVRKHNLSAKLLQDFGWPAVELPQ